MTHRWLLLLIAAGTVLVSPLAGEETDSEQVRRGHQLYLDYCGSCHGQYARGDGPLAEHLKVAPSDLTRISQRNDGEFPHERVAKSIDGRDETIAAHGSREMPIWGNALSAFSFSAPRGGGEVTVKRKIDDLVQYLSSIQEAGEPPPEP